MVSSSKPSNIYSDQQILMGALPLLLLKDKSLFDSPPKFYYKIKRHFADTIPSTKAGYANG